MLLPKFDYQAPKSLREACNILDEFGAKAKLLAGGDGSPGQPEAENGRPGTGHQPE